MADREEILRVALDHLHFYESRRGKVIGVDRDSSGVERSRGHYHVMLDRARLLDKDKYGKMSQSDYNAIIGESKDEDDNVREASNKKAEAEGKRLAGLYLEDIMKKSRVDFSGLTVGESVAFLSMNYNSGLDANPTTQKAFRLLANARNRNDPELGLYMKAARGLIDLTKEKQAEGKASIVLAGILNRNDGHKKTFDGELNPENTFGKLSGEIGEAEKNLEEEDPRGIQISYDKKEMELRDAYRRTVRESSDAKVFVKEEMFLLQNEPVMAGFLNKFSEIGLGTFTSPEGTTRDVTIKEDEKLEEVPQLEEMQQGAN